jgi:predicted TPR repeat methyltransferase
MPETGPLFVTSGDLVADRRYKFALDLAAREDFGAAADLLEQTVEAAPGFATAWFALGAIRDRMGDRGGAIAAFERARDADPQDYHGARLQLARLGSGEAAPAMTETYIRRLFDQYAGRYDLALTEHLNYRGPAILRERIAGTMRAAGRPEHFAAMLDLGCGTGLAGASFRSIVDRLTGVDLSPAMVAQAKAKGIYDRLECDALADFLAAEIAAAARYDLVLAADVFVYVNDIAPVIAAIARVLTPDGVLAFTVETHSGEGVKLLPTLRFAYGETFLRAAIARAGLSLVEISQAAVRTEKGVPVSGLVVVARAAADH